MIARSLLVAMLALLVGCTGLPGSFQRAAQDVDAREPVAEVGPGESEDGDADAPIDPGQDSEAAPQEDTETKPVEDSAETPPAKPDANATARAKCLADGGNFTRTKAGAFVCVTRTGDSGSICTGSSQCEGACLARSGTCSPVTPLIGCHDIVTDSGGMSTVCID